MKADCPVISVMSFDVHPGFATDWSQTWHELRDRALATPGCLDFRLLRNRHDENHRLVISEWERPNDLDEFVRRIGLVWLLRGVGATRGPVRCTVFDVSEPEASQSQKPPKMISVSSRLLHTHNRATPVTAGV